MLELIMEAIKDLALMFGASLGINFILRNKLRIPTDIHQAKLLPIVVAIEEGLFRVLPFFVMGFLPIDPIIKIVISAIPFAAIHLGNLKDVPHTSIQATKYLINVATLGFILG